MTPIETVDAFIAAIEAGDLDQAVSLVDPQISYENVPTDPIHGAENMRKSLARFSASTTAMQWVIVSQVAVGNVVINERIDRFQINGKWAELPVAGFFTLNDEGRITLWRDYFDMNTYVQQMAAVREKE
jgi:limonene-1,2-epoxide hydrolase